MPERHQPSREEKREQRRWEALVQRLDDLAWKKNAPPLALRLHRDARREERR